MAKAFPSIGKKPAASKLPKAAAVSVSLGKSAKPALKAGGMKMPKAGKKGC